MSSLRLISSGVHVAGLGFEVETETGELFAIARDQPSADLVAEAVNAYRPHDDPLHQRHVSEATAARASRMRRS